MAITLAEAKALKLGVYLYHINNRNSDGSPQRCRVNGKPQTWKTRPNEVRVPVKFGLRHCEQLTERDLELVCLNETEALLGDWIRASFEFQESGLTKQTKVEVIDQLKSLREWLERNDASDSGHLPFDVVDEKGEVGHANLYLATLGLQRKAHNFKFALVARAKGPDPHNLYSILIIDRVLTRVCFAIRKEGE